MRRDLWEGAIWGLAVMFVAALLAMVTIHYANTARRAIGDTVERTSFDNRVRSAWAKAAHCGGYVVVEWNRDTREVDVLVVNCDL